jgi:hypothetical protein
VIQSGFPTVNCIQRRNIPAKQVKSTIRNTLPATAALLAGSMLTGPAVAVPADRARDFDPIVAYGEGIVFDVLRNGAPVGSHVVTFDRDGRELLVRSRMRLAVEMLFITVYRLDYLSVARWQVGRMAGLNVTVDDNGTPFSLSAASPEDGKALQVQAGENSYVARQPLYPTNHWNPGVLGQTQVLNTLTGRLNTVRIEKRGRETVPTELGPVTATHFAYTGDLLTEVWYDDAGRWVKMRFKGADGSNIEYRCRRCQGATAIGAADAE